MTASASAISWAETNFLFAFGDSYTTDGYNVSAGINSSFIDYTSSNGLNWVQYMTSLYNSTEMTLFNLAYGGATIDSALVPPYAPSVVSIVDQVSQFNEILAPKPPGAEWNSNNALFAFWIGINDVGNSYTWTNVSQVAFHAQLMNRLFGQVESLYEHGARAFVFLTVPPTNRAPMLIEAGPEAVAKITPEISDYNKQLQQSAQAFRNKHKDLQQLVVYDTQPVFNTLLDNAKSFGYVNITGYCEAYVNGTPQPGTRISPCAPVSSYFWLNTLHPLFTIHSAIANGVVTSLNAGQTE